MISGKKWIHISNWDDLIENLEYYMLLHFHGKEVFCPLCGNSLEKIYNKKGLERAIIILKYNIICDECKNKE